MSVLTVHLREEIASVVAMMHVMVAKKGRPASATSIGIFLALGFIDADLGYFQGDAVITTPGVTYRYFGDAWHIETSNSTQTTFVLVRTAVEATALDLFLQAATDQYIVLAYTEADMEVIATAYVMAKKRFLTR